MVIEVRPIYEDFIDDVEIFCEEYHGVVGGEVQTNTKRITYQDLVLMIECAKQAYEMKYGNPPKYLKLPYVLWKILCSGVEFKYEDVLSFRELILCPTYSVGLGEIEVF